MVTVMQVGQNLQSKAGDIKDKVRLQSVEQPFEELYGGQHGVCKAHRLAILLCGACIEALALLPCCAMHYICVLDACQMGQMGLCVRRQPSSRALPRLRARATPLAARPRYGCA